jgi:hypothetical protein
VIPAPRGEEPEAYQRHRCDEDKAAGERKSLNELDEQLICLLVSRVDRAREDQRARQAAGLPATRLSWENEMLRSYASRLGEHGTQIARAILALSRPPAVAPARRESARGGAGRPGRPGG